MKNKKSGDEFSIGEICEIPIYVLKNGEEPKRQLIDARVFSIRDYDRIVTVFYSDPITGQLKYRDFLYYMLYKKIK